MTLKDIIEDEREEARAEGRAEGSFEKAREMAKAILALGKLSVPEISVVSGLSEAEIKSFNL